MAMMWVVFVKVPATLQQVMGYDVMRPNQQNCVTENYFLLRAKKEGLSMLAT